MIQGCQGEIDGTGFGVANTLQVCFVVGRLCVAGSDTSIGWLRPTRLARMSWTPIYI